LIVWPVAALAQTRQSRRLPDLEQLARRKFRVGRICYRPNRPAWSFVQVYASFSKTQGLIARNSYMIANGTNT